MQRCEVVMEADPYTPSNIYVEALNRFRLTQTKCTELKGKDKKNKFHRSDLAKANKANKRAEIRFIEMFLEACQIYIDKHGLEENDTVFKSLKDFLTSLEIVGNRRSWYSLCLERVRIRCAWTILFEARRCRPNSILYYNRRISFKD